MAVRMEAMGARLWMACNVLEQGPVLSPDQAWNLTREYGRAWQTCRMQTRLFQGTSTSVCFWRQPMRRYAELAAQSAIDARSQAQVKVALDCLRRHDFGRCLCHGDLGPRNIMSQGGGPVAIDREDAFWGVEGYDYLLWLTFLREQVSL